MRKILVYKILWWTTPILNYLFSIIIDWIDSLNNVNNEHPPLYWSIYVIGNVMLIIWLYLYLWICSLRGFNKQAVMIITVLAAFVQTIIHFGVIAFVTSTTLDLYIYDNTFPVGEFIYSLLYFIPFYIVAFILRRKLYQTE